MPSDGISNPRRSSSSPPGPGWCWNAAEGSGASQRKKLPHGDDIEMPNRDRNHGFYNSWSTYRHWYQVMYMYIYIYYITVYNTYACIYIYMCVRVYIYIAYIQHFTTNNMMFGCVLKNQIYSRIYLPEYFPRYFHCNAKNVFLELGIEVVPVVPVVPHDLFWSNPFPFLHCVCL